MDDLEAGEVCQHGGIKRECTICELNELVLIFNEMIRQEATISRYELIIKRLYGFADTAELYHDLLAVMDEDEADAYMQEIKKIACERNKGDSP